MPSEIKWIKIVTDIFDDEKILLIESMPDADTIIVIWFKILCLAGKLNNCGVLVLNERIAYTDEMLAQVFRRPVGTVRLALTTFEKFGMIEIINDTVTIPNWMKYQNAEGLDKIREQNRLRKQKERELKRLSTSCDNSSHDASRDSHVTVTHSSYSISNNSSSQSPSKNGENGVKGKEGDIQTEMFDKFWNAYDNKKGKKNAEKAFRRISPDSELFQKIMDGVKKYHNSRKWKEGYRKEPATWLNGECWNDEYDEESEVRRSGDNRGYRAGDHSTPRTVYDLKPQFAGHEHDGNDITDS